MKKKVVLEQSNLQTSFTQFAKAIEPSIVMKNALAQIMENISPSLIIQNSLSKIAESFSPLLVMKNYLAVISNSIRPDLLAQNAHENISEGFQQSIILWQKNLADSFKNISNQIEAIGETTQKFKAIIVELGWPPNDSLDFHDINSIIEAYDKYGSEYIKNDIEKYFLKKFDQKEVNDILKNWEETKSFKNRLPILRQAINAHLEGNYYISVPAFLPQIEGIIVDGYGHNGRMNGERLEKYFRDLLSSTNTFSFDIAVQEFLLQYVLAEFQHGISPKSCLSRHAILHGADTKYGTAANSLRCILLIDYLLDKFGYIGVGKGKSYHLLGCPVVVKYRIRHGNKNWVIFEDRYEAEKTGKKKCKICKP
jgi:hypothetical protein